MNSWTGRGQWSVKACIEGWLGWTGGYVVRYELVNCPNNG